MEGVLGGCGGCGGGGGGALREAEREARSQARGLGMMGENVVLRASIVLLVPIRTVFAPSVGLLA